MQEAIILFRDHTGDVTCLTLASANDWLISGSSDTTIIIYKISTCQILHTLKGHKKTVTCLKYIHSSNLLLSGKRLLSFLWLSHFTVSGKRLLSFSLWLSHFTISGKRLLSFFMIVTLYHVSAGVGEGIKGT